MNETEICQIRAADPGEARKLTDLTLRSKAHWGYSEAFMAAAVHELEFRPEKFQPDFLVYVVEERDTVAGFCSLLPMDRTTIELHDLFVDVPFIRHGYGKKLWLHAVDIARASGFSRMILTADPNAEAFYVAQGARRIGEKPSTIQEGRSLPLLEYVL
jgi:GNAT superfamily N-acetyltransferase